MKKVLTAYRRDDIMIVSVMTLNIRRGSDVLTAQQVSETCCDP